MVGLRSVAPGVETKMEPYQPLPNCVVKTIEEGFLYRFMYPNFLGSGGEKKKKR